MDQETVAPKDTCTADPPTVDGVTLEPTNVNCDGVTLEPTNVNCDDVTVPIPANREVDANDTCSSTDGPLPCVVDAVPQDEREEHDDTKEVEECPVDSMSVCDEAVESEIAEQQTVVRAMFNFKQVPTQITGAWSEFEKPMDNFLRGCKWAPDGSCVLTNSGDNYLRIFNLPSVFYGSEESSWDSVTEMVSAVKIREGELIYDFCWYPCMSSTDYATCCFVNTSRNNPIHMYDAYSGELRCSYRAFNQVDEIDAAYSLQFSPNGQKLYSGFNKTIRIFDVNVPGRTFEERKTKVHGQYGIISAIAVSPNSGRIYAAGSYSKSIAIYGESDGSMVCLLEGQQGGITHLIFSRDGTRIFSGGRKDPEIICWDLRNPGEVLFTMKRDVQTNQRIHFDMDGSEQFIVSGNNSGHVSVWDATEIQDGTTSEQVLNPTLTFMAHDDCVNGIGLHPTLPLMTTTSGQRKFAEPAHSEDSSDSDSDIFTQKYIVRDNSLRLWWCG